MACPCSGQHLARQVGTPLYAAATAVFFLVLLLLGLPIIGSSYSIYHTLWLQCFCGKYNAPLPPSPCHSPAPRWRPSQHPGEFSSNCIFTNIISPPGAWGGGFISPFSPTSLQEILGETTWPTPYRPEGLSNLCTGWVYRPRSSFHQHTPQTLSLLTPAEFC